MIFISTGITKGNQLFYEADQGLQLFSDPHLVITIIRNLTDNANKYTNQGEIRIIAKTGRRGPAYPGSRHRSGHEPQSGSGLPWRRKSR